MAIGSSAAFDDPSPPPTAREQHGRTACPNCESRGPHRVTGFLGGALVACARCGRNWEAKDAPPSGGAA